MARILLCLLLCGCWPPVYSLEDVQARELHRSTRYRFRRLDEERVRVLYWNHYGDCSVYTFDWPRDSGTLIGASGRLSTADGSDPVLIEEKYQFNGR
jgi:hypothetical protein